MQPLSLGWSANVNERQRSIGKKIGAPLNCYKFLKVAVMELRLDHIKPPLPQIVLTIEFRKLRDFEHGVQSLHNMSFWSVILDPHLTTHHSNISVQFSNQIRPVYFIGKKIVPHRGSIYQVLYASHVVRGCRHTCSKTRVLKRSSVGYGKSILALTCAWSWGAWFYGWFLSFFGGGAKSVRIQLRLETEGFLALQKHYLRLEVENERFNPIKEGPTLKPKLLKIRHMSRPKFFLPWHHLPPVIQNHRFKICAASTWVF